ncbi:MAG: hypothetical protein KZQ90_12870 [Candidatus Thiodiazotropha sp. (ex Codakia rugifera)]|nr:hypothetical protein [Candidatus Thiodiazotropha sp. (ex Codakia rugifera)]
MDQLYPIPEEIEQGYAEEHKKDRRGINMPKLTSGLTQKERLKVIQSIDMIKSAQNAHEKHVLELYRERITREFQDAKVYSATG